MGTVISGVAIYDPTTYIYIYLGILIDKCYGHIFYETNVDGASGPKTEQWCLLQTNGFLNSISARTMDPMDPMDPLCVLSSSFDVSNFRFKIQ